MFHKSFSVEKLFQGFSNVSKSNIFSYLHFNYTLQQKKIKKLSLQSSYIIVKSEKIQFDLLHLTQNLHLNIGSALIFSKFHIHLT